MIFYDFLLNLFVCCCCCCFWGGGRGVRGGVCFMVPSTEPSDGLLGMGKVGSRVPVPMTTFARSKRFRTLQSVTQSKI